MGYKFLAPGADSFVYFDAEQKTIKKVYKYHISHDDITRYHEIHSALSAKKYNISLSSAPFSYDTVVYTKAIFSVLNLGTSIDVDNQWTVTTYPPYVAGKTFSDLKSGIFTHIDFLDKTTTQQLLEIFLNEIYDDNPAFVEYMHHIHGMNIKVIPQDDNLQFIVTDMGNMIPKFIQSYDEAQKDQESLDTLAKDIENQLVK